jgi:hypothetical protein
MPDEVTALLKLCFASFGLRLLPGTGKSVYT